MVSQVQNYSYFIKQNYSLYSLIYLHSQTLLAYFQVEIFVKTLNSVIEIRIAVTLKK